MKLHLKKTTRTDFLTYIGVIIAFIVMSSMQGAGMLSRSLSGQLVPICCYMSMAVSLNLTVGILGELSLGHAGFMSMGAFSGITAAMCLQSAIPSAPLRLAAAMVVGAVFAAITGLIGATIWPLSPWPAARSSRTWSTAFWWAMTPMACIWPSTSPAL